MTKEDIAVKKKVKKSIKKGNVSNLLKFIITKTFTRHAFLDEKSYLKEIGFDKIKKSEDEAINMSLMNVLIETTSQLIAIQKTIDLLTASFIVLEQDKDGIKEEHKGEKKDA